MTHRHASRAAARRPAEVALVPTEHSLAVLLRNLPGMAYRCRNDTTWTMEFVSYGCLALTGYTAEELTGSHAVAYNDLIVPDDRQMVWDNVQHAVERRVPFVLVYRIRTKDGQEKWVWEQGMGIPDSTGAVPVLEGFITDITEQKRTEEALRASEAYQRAIISAAPNIIVGLDHDAHIVLFNRFAEQLTGYAEQEVVGRNWIDTFIPTELQDELRAIWDMLVSRQLTQHHHENCIVTKSGERRLISWNNTVLTDNGVFRMLLSIGEDVTERRRAEAAMAAQLAELKRWQAVMLDYSDRSQELKREVNALLQRLGEPPRYTSVTTGCTSPPQVPLPNTVGDRDSAADEAARSRRALLDVLEEHQRAEQRERRLQAQLAYAQKMESIGRLAGGIAHDFNNMLSVILGTADLALRRVERSSPLYQDLQEIITAAQHSAEITRQLLAFARRQTIAPRALDLNATIESLLSMLRRLIGEDVNLVWQPAAMPLTVLMDPAQVDQILANLCVNARDAIVDVGTITIETSLAVFDEEYCASHAGTFPGTFVMLAVSDNGHGMDARTQENMFEPFFTTKETGKGTGLGLATVYGIVKQNDGFINVYSEPGKGTTFKIYLPHHARPAEGLPTPQTTALPLGHGEMILIVEDEGALLKLSHTMLESAGYRVLTADNPRHALQLARAHAGGIDLLITDVVMADMNGRDLARQIQERCPRLKVLFMSGYTANVIAHHGILDASVHFLQKPFSRHDLAMKVHEVLHAPA